MTTDYEIHQLISNVLISLGHPSAATPISSNTPLVDGGLELTSLDLVRIFVELEDELQMEMDDTAMFELNFERVEDIVVLIRSSLRVIDLDA